MVADSVASTNYSFAAFTYSSTYANARSYCFTQQHPNARLAIIRDNVTMAALYQSANSWIGLNRTITGGYATANWYWEDGVSWLDRTPLWGTSEPYDRTAAVLGTAGNMIISANTGDTNTIVICEVARNCSFDWINT
jgi:hypothetical protein